MERNVGKTLAEYVQLTKPRIVVLLLLTAAASMFVAGEGRPPLETVFFTLLGGALAAGSSNAFNSWYERDLDALMERTAHRPLVRKAMAPEKALNFSVGLAIASVLVFWWMTNTLATVLVILAMATYDFFYTMGLKRRTPQNIVWGGLAGVFPPLIGWAAVRGTLDPAAWVLALVIFLWTPPHFWSLALVRREEYARATVPMLPVVKGEERTRWEILVYALLYVASTLLLSWPLGALGNLYGYSAVVLGAGFVAVALNLLLRKDDRSSRTVFSYSNLHLSLLFAFMVLDVAYSRYLKGAL